MARQMHCDYISKKKKKKEKGGSGEKERNVERKRGQKKEKGKCNQRGIQMGSSAGEAADVRNSTWKSLCFFFPSKAVLHFDYLVLLRAIQGALFVSVRLEI